MTSTTSPVAATPTPANLPPPLTYQFADGVATIALDDGKANVMSLRMLHAINGALDQALADKAIVVITGRPGIFSGGFDLGVFKRAPQEQVQMLEAGARLTERLLSHPHPVVAVCTGHAIAMGVFTLLCADVRIGLNAGFNVQANEVLIGMTLPYFALEVCKARLSPASLTTAVCTAQPFTGQAAVAAGFLDEVVAPELLADAVQASVARLKKLHGPSFTATKLRLRADTLVALRAAIAQDVIDWSARLVQV